MSLKRIHILKNALSSLLNKNLKTKEEDIEKHKHESGKLINKNLNLNNFEFKKNT